MLQHRLIPDTVFDGGNLDCGNGLLLLIRKHLDPLQRGGLLEILSTELSVEEDLPAWARLTGNEVVSVLRRGEQRSFLICKGSLGERTSPAAVVGSAHTKPLPFLASSKASSPTISGVPRIAPLSVMGIGSWPRPRWMLQAIHDHLEGRMDERTFQQTADDAVRLSVAAQERAGIDVISDGEQRRDNYASFVGGRLDCCQLIPITDLLPYVADPEKFADELRALDVPAEKVRHPAILRRLQRDRPLALHELEFVQTITQRPVKVALPGPYLLTRTMWLECVSERVYEEREQLAEDVITVLREEIQSLLDAGAALVQIDEPVLSEVVFGHARKKRSFMCGALGERRGTDEELHFAGRLIQRVLANFPRERLGLHICRGNWSRDESLALQGDYSALIGLLKTVSAGTFFLEMCTPRAGELDSLRELPAECRVGLGVVNPKSERVESVEEIMTAAQRAIEIFGFDRVLLNPDCGFATFADNPVASAQVAEAKLANIVEASRRLRGSQTSGDEKPSR
jgi:5-methyltetrahydropteroyltriglutamate--homocysteine methyltransferase